MRRLHPRGVASRGVVVDADGATLGPDCILVRRTGDEYRCVSRNEAASIQAVAFGASDDRDWLFRQSRHIAKALAAREIALAQIFGLRIPVADLDAQQLVRLAAVGSLIKANFNPDEPRDEHGRWADADGGGLGAETGSEGSSESGLANSPRDGGDRGIKPASPSVGSGSIGPDASDTLLRPVNEITFGHGSRHVANPEGVEGAIRNALSAAPLLPGFNSGTVNVGGTWYIYRAFLLPDGRIHVGTYYPW